MRHFTIRHLGKYLICAMLVMNLALAFPAASRASELKAIVLIEKSIKVYDSALNGFRSVCNAGITEFEVGTQNAPEFYKTKPSFIVAVGGDALAEAEKSGHDVPIIYVMVLDPQIPPGVPATGVGLTVSFDDQFRELSRVLPSARRIGVLYTPRLTGTLFEAARKAAEARGLVLVGRAITSDDGTVSALNEMRGKIDVLWMLPDTAILRYDTVKYFMLYSFENKIPIFALSGKYVENGALMALDIDPFDMGRQAGEMANELLAGKSIQSIPPRHARRWRLVLNLSTARKMGIRVPGDVLRGAVEIR